MLKVDSTWAESFFAGIFFPEVTTHVFVILGLRTKSFRTFNKRFSTIFKTAVYNSTDKFCGKKNFHQFRILSQRFLPLFHKNAGRYSKLHLACPGEKFEENYCLFWKTKNTIWFFFCFSSQNLSENLLKLHSKRPEDLLQGKKLLKTTQNCLSFLRLEANNFWIFGKPFSIEVSKLLFMCPNKRNVEESLFISSKIWEKYSRISGKKRDLHSVLSQTALSVWRESLTEIPSDFFAVFSRVSKLDTSSAEKMFEENTFHEKDFWIYRFRTLTELHLSVQRNVLFRITVLDFFSWVHDFGPTVLIFGRFFLNFVFENALYVTTTAFIKCFILEKPRICLWFSIFEQKRSVVWLSFFNRTVKIVFYVSKWTLRVKKFFEKKVFHHVFWTLIRERADFVSIFSPALTKLHLRIHRNVPTKTDDFWKGCIFPGVLLKNFGPSMEFFSRFVETTFKLSRGKLWETYYWENISSQFHIPWEICGGLFRTESCVSSVLFWEKLSSSLENQNFVIQFWLWSKKNLPFFQKTSESSV